MVKKRVAEPGPPTDEWGIYDPARAGMQALYLRLGRPILRASAAATRRERRRAARPERPADGVGLAIEEVKRRAGLKAAAAVAAGAPPAVNVDPVAVDRVGFAAESGEPAPVVVVAPRKKPRKAPAAPKAGQDRDRRSGLRGEMEAAMTVRARQTAAAEGAVAADTADAPGVAPTPRPRGRKSTRLREATPPAAPAAVAATTPAVPPPSPARPRGAVPLAAWAHAVNDTPRAEPRRSDGRGLWRAMFTIPSEVALVEYGRGCRIHRLVIQAAPEVFEDPL